jgi:tetratricopeptide (TPR) repeat protein
MSSIPDDSSLPPVPQSGRLATPAPSIEPRNLWQQLLATLDEVGNAIDPFANDMRSDVRALGRLARQRHPQRANNYFALGDLCARLTFDGAHLNQTYVEKAILAYQRAGESSTGDAAVARRMIFTFAVWVAGTARILNSYLDLEAGLFACRRALQFETDPDSSVTATQLVDLIARTEMQIGHILNKQELAPDETATLSPQRHSQKITDEGQMFLRRQRIDEALDAFARAIEADDRNSAAWLWQALALTDVARFEEALASYDRAIALNPDNYGAQNSKGALLLELGQIEAALHCFEQALTMPAPSTLVKAAFLLNKGKALYMLERYSAARAALQQSDELAPNQESAAGVLACNEMLGATDAEDTPGT